MHGNAVNNRLNNTLKAFFLNYCAFYIKKTFNTEFSLENLYLLFHFHINSCFLYA